MLVENVDYELIPHEETDWHIRILTGEFTETVIQFGAIQENDGELNFNFDLIFSPDFDLTTENTDLQNHAGSILLSIINESLSKSRKNDNKHRTDDH